MAERTPERKHRWSAAELAELFYDAILRDHRSENYTGGEMRSMAAAAAAAALPHAGLATMRDTPTRGRTTK